MANQRVLVLSYVYVTDAEGSRVLKHVPGDVISLDEAVALGIATEDGELKVRTAKVRAPH